MKKIDKTMAVEENSDKLERMRLEAEVLRFAMEKGWDENRQIQVLAELTYPEPMVEIIDECVSVGWTDGLLEQLHQYYDKEDYFSWLLEALLCAKPSVEVNTGLIDAVSSRLHEIRAIDTQVNESEVA